MNTVIEKTTKSDQKIASKSIDKIKQTNKTISKSKKQSIEIRIEETGEVLSIPKRAFTLLKVILENMSEGKTLTIASEDEELSTQQAAEILNISRPYLVKLLEDEKISFRKVGTHRRVKLKDLLEYEKTLRNKRRQTLDRLSKQGQKLKMGYE